MLQIIDQTREEHVAVLMKLPKWTLVEMLLNNQDLVTAQQQELERRAPEGAGPAECVALADR